ncbi:hypothetical protein QBC34DRAFT_385847 [Podospora aff. communis PSN243]|uniref:Uncharacterized protein n=1 Tax=Podospora aff. communis PSN243 TaxID=3040156 RepID=A0AAV9G7B3_9PEZI|nr:hypothetical protein QBC34DRAFT_385847 [Podospora aff. communis PSN243]
MAANQKKQGHGKKTISELENILHDVINDTMELDDAVRADEFHLGAETIDKRQATAAGMQEKMQRAANVTKETRKMLDVVVKNLDRVEEPHLRSRLIDLPQHLLDRILNMWRTPAAALAGFQKQLRETRASIEALTGTNQTLRASLTASEKQCEGLQKELETLTEKQGPLVQENSELTVDLDVSRTNCERLEAQVTELTAQVSRADNEKRQHDHQAKRLHDDLAAAKEGIAKSKTTVERLRGERDDLRGQLAQAKHEREKLKETCEKVRMQLRDCYKKDRSDLERDRGHLRQVVANISARQAPKGGTSASAKSTAGELAVLLVNDWWAHLDIE